MAYALVDSVSSTGGPNGGTTGAIDTTGADLLVQVGAGLTGMAYSDSYINDWTVLTAELHGGARVEIAYVKNPIVGAGHTFTNSGSSIFAPVLAAAFSGGELTDPFDQENGNFADPDAFTLTTGSITPTEDGELVIAGIWDSGDLGFFSIDDGFTIAKQQAPIGSNNFGGALAYLIQTSAAAANPTWTDVNEKLRVAVIASFKAAASGTNVTPDPVVVEASVVAPSVSLRLSPAPVVTNLQVVAPAVALKSTPAPVEVEARVVAPTVTVGGSTIVTPDPVVLIARVVAPTVQLIGRGLDGVSSPRILEPGQLYGVEPQWLRELRQRRRPPRVEEPRENPDDPAVVRARLDRLWLEQEREEEEWLLGL